MKSCFLFIEIVDNSLESTLPVGREVVLPAAKGCGHVESRLKSFRPITSLQTGPEMVENAILNITM